MRAIVVREFGGPDVMKLEDVPAPTPSPTEVLVRVRAAGINPVDTYIRAGVYAFKPPLPFTPGMDGAGEIETVGADVKGFKAGDRVYIANDNAAGPRLGVYAEQLLCTPNLLHHLPDRLSFAQGAAVGVPYCTMCYALFKRANARPGETVLVHGASGGVGTAAVQIARAHGMRVIGTAGTERGIELVRAQGADVVVNHHDPTYLEAIKEATGGRGLDVILETNAHLNLDKDLTLLARLGRVVIVGSRGRVEIDPRGTMGREASIHGMALLNVVASEFTWMNAAIAAGLANGTLNPIVGREFPLSDAVLAHEAVLAPGALGKIVLVP